MDGETKRKVASIKFKPDHSLRINIRKSLLKRGGGFYEHTHDCTEVAIVTRGSATHIVNGRGHFVKSGDVYVIKPGVSHGFENADEMVHYVFSYMPEMLDAIGRDIRMTVGFQTLFAIGHGQGRPSTRCSASPWSPSPSSKP
jgi:quercetin dioxygenase-like cupin family protein